MALFWVILILCLAISTSPGLFAQQAKTAPADTPPPLDEEVVEMNPFEVNASSNRGWNATETLSGTRLRTNLKDVPNQIETLTKEFMENFALSDVNEALIYSANTENETEYWKSTTGTQIQNPEGGARIRGLGSGSKTRNFFTSFMPVDLYNLDRATIASGPNAILFSLGSPSGMFDSTTSRARMTDKYRFSLRYDSEDSKRGTFDLNQMIIKNRFAVRLMGLSKKQYTFKKPNLDRDDRIYLALHARITPGTTVHFQYERQSRNWNRASRIVPYDGVTLWLRADQIPGSGYAAPMPAYDNRTLVPAGNMIFARGPAAPVFVVNGSVPLTNWTYSVIVKNPSTLPDVDPVFDADKNYTFLDENIVPFDVNLAGMGRTVLSGGNIRTLTIDQRITQDLHAEFAYNHENYHSHAVSFGGYSAGQDAFLRVDANMYLPGRAPDNTTPNPNFGKYYYEGYTNSQFLYRTADAARLTLSYDLDFSRRIRSPWGKWLGRHFFSGLYSVSETADHRQAGFEHLLLDDTPAINGGVALRPRSNANWAAHGSRRVYFRYYMDGAIQGAGPATSQNFWGSWTVPDANGNPATLSFLDTGLFDANGKRLGARAAPILNRVRNDTKIFVWQGFLLPDRRQQPRLILSFGYRKDSPKTSNADVASVTRDFSGLYPQLWDATATPFESVASGISRNYGAVLRPFRWLSLFYNKSGTFDLATGRYDPFGQPVASVTGEGHDYGVRIDLLQDRLSLRINRYKNTLGPSTAPTAINRLGQNLYKLEARVLDLDPTLPTLADAGYPQAVPTFVSTVYQVSEYFESTGYEFELNYSPAPSWNFKLNGAFTKAVESDIGAKWMEFAAARLPAWQGLVATNGETDTQGNPLTWDTAPIDHNNGSMTLADYYNNQIVANEFAFLRAIDGRASDNARNARANFIGRYSFRTGALRGLSIGGAARWREAPVIGYGTTLSEGGETILDLGKKYKGKHELYYDAFLSYSGRLPFFKKVRYMLQLNIRNLLDEHSAIPFTASVMGKTIRLATVEPRLVMITATFEY